jgi:hypothetical protein
VSSYKDNFDEFGQLREDHSPWTLPDLLIATALVGFLVGLVFGLF